MNLTEIRELVAKPQQAVDQIIIHNLHSHVPLIEQIGRYIVENGGKRLRPLLVLLSAAACGSCDARQQQLAAIIELIHTATLLHDDVVDESSLRRGQETANAVWGDHSSVLVGDFLYSRAFQMMVALENMTVMSVMAKTTNTISEGEVLQLLNAHDHSTNEARYFEVIERKTAILFAAACQLAAVMAEQNEMIQKALYNYGLALGIAYQLVDDVLDYNADSQMLGKNMGDDLAEGKPTLPLIYLLQHGDEKIQTRIRDAIVHGKLEQLSEIQNALHESGALTYTLQQAQCYVQRANTALNALPDTPYKKALAALADFVVARTY